MSGWGGERKGFVSNSFCAPHIHQWYVGKFGSLWHYLMRKHTFQCTQRLLWFIRGYSVLRCSAWRDNGREFRSFQLKIGDVLKIRDSAMRGAACVCIAIVLSLVNKTQGRRFTGNIFADNWFRLYVNGKEVAADPVRFLPHNSVSFQFDDGE